MKLRITKYTDENMLLWDQFIENDSVNGTFLQQRNFLNYHKVGRFEDCSFIIYDKEMIIAVCPACVLWESGRKVFYSHGGSTYGGIILHKRLLRIKNLKCVFEKIEEFLIEQKFEKCVLKLTMDLLCRCPQDIVKFYLTYSGYKEIKELNLYIDYSSYKKDILDNFSKMKRRNVSKCLKSEIKLREIQDKAEISCLHKIITDNLLKYQTCPVHTAEELSELRNRLGSHIEFYGAYFEGKLIAGTMVFIFHKTKCAHTQYLAADPEYSDMNAMTFIYYKMVELFMKRGFSFLSWGTVTEHGGKLINWGLANHKEEFGSTYLINSIFEKELDILRR